MHKELARSHSYVVTLSCLAVICTQAGMMMYTPSIPSLSKVFNVEYAEITHTLTAYLLGYAIAVLCFGGISDQLGRKKSYVITTTIFSFASILLAITHSIYIFILLRFLQGVGGGGCAVIARASVRDILEGKKLVSAMSYISISFIISMGIFQYLGGIIQTYANYKYDFIFMSCFGVLVLMLVIFQFNETHHPSNSKFEIGNLIKNYCNILRENYLIPIAIGGGIGYSILLAFNVLGVYYLQIHLKVSPKTIGIIGIYFSIAYLLGSLLVNKLIKISNTDVLIKTGKIIILVGGVFSIAGIVVDRNSLLLIS